MRKNAKANLGQALRMLTKHKDAKAPVLRALRRVMRDEDMQAELAKRLKERFGINVDNLRELLELVIEYGPQVLKLVMEIVALFS